jgi:hypothetical protein
MKNIVTHVIVVINAIHPIIVIAIMTKEKIIVLMMKMIMDMDMVMKVILLIQKMSTSKQQLFM